MRIKKFFESVQFKKYIIDFFESTYYLFSVENQEQGTVVANRIMIYDMDEKKFLRFLNPQVLLNEDDFNVIYESDDLEDATEHFMMLINANKYNL